MPSGAGAEVREDPGDAPFSQGGQGGRTVPAWSACALLWLPGHAAGARTKPPEKNRRAGKGCAETALSLDSPSRYSIVSAVGPGGCLPSP